MKYGVLILDFYVYYKVCEKQRYCDQVFFKGVLGNKLLQWKPWFPRWWFYIQFLIWYIFFYQDLFSSCL